MRFFLILLMAFLSISIAQNERPLTPADQKEFEKIANRESAKITTTLKEKVVDGYLLDAFEDKESPFHEIKIKCESDHKDDADARSECMAKAFDKKLSNDFKDEDVVELGKNLNLKNFGLVERETKEGVKDYLTDRLNKSLFGDDYESRMKKTNNQKMDTFKEGDRFVAHGNFYNIYESQVNKQILTELSAYCLESFELDIDGSKGLTLEDHGVEISPDQKIIDKCPSIKKTNTLLAKEIKYDPSKSKKDELEKKLSTQLNQDQCVTKYTYQLCVVQGLGLICNHYQRKVADLVKKTSLEGKLKDKDDIPGSRACALMNRLRSYKKVAKTLHQTREDMKSMQQGKDVGFQAETFYGDGAYKGDGTKGDTVSEITNIASASIKKSYEGANEQLKDFKKDCTDGSQDECDKYFDGNEYDHLQKAKVEHHAATEIKAKQIMALKDGELEKFVEQEGYEGPLKLCQEAEENQNDPEKVKECVTNVFKAERLAVIKEIEQRINGVAIKKETAGNTSTDPAENQKKVEKRQEYFEEESARIERIYQYNNVVTSYLDVTYKDANGETTEGGANIKAFENEKEKYEGSDSNYFSKVTKFHDPSKNRQPSSNENERDCINIGFIDTVLGYISKDENAQGCAN